MHASPKIGDLAAGLICVFEQYDSPVSVDCFLCGKYSVGLI